MLDIYYLSIQEEDVVQLAMNGVLFTIIGNLLKIQVLVNIRKVHNLVSMVIANITKVCEVIFDELYMTNYVSV
jgi:hypothetical protein